MGYQGVIDSATHDGRPYGFNGRDILALCERHQNQSITDLPKDINCISAGDAWPHW
jgi:hypothetical protein